MTQYDPMEILKSVKEPFNKNTLWIYPIDGNFEFKIFDKGWRIIGTTKDLGLTDNSKQQVENLVNEFKNTFNFKINKQFAKCTATLLNLMSKNRELEHRLNELENKLERLTKRYGTLMAKN